MVLDTGMDCGGRAKLLHLVQVASYAVRLESDRLKVRLSLSSASMIYVRNGADWDT